MGIGGRTTSLGYAGGDGVRQQFTLKERDVETGLDYFGARYFASTQGRFTSPDPLLASQRPGAPQTLNRYSYVLNNPLRLIDPTGLADTEEEQKKETPPVRTVYIFITFTTPEQQENTTPDSPSVPPFVSQDAPNFQSLQGIDPVNQANPSIGTAVQILSGNQATLAAWNAALDDPNAAGVFFIGHAASTQPNVSPFQNDSGINLSDGTFNPSGGTTVKAQTVGIFACDSQSSAGLFRMGSGQSLIGMNSGATNGLTSTDALSRAAYAAANETVRGRGPDAAVLAANGVIDGASRGRTVTAPGGQSIGKRPNSLNTDGDRVRRLH